MGQGGYESQPHWGHRDWLDREWQEGGGMNLTIEWEKMSRGERIRTLRRLHNITQEELATAVSRSRQTVVSWESDRSDPDLDSAHTMAALFQVSLELLSAPQESP